MLFAPVKAKGGAKARGEVKGEVRLPDNGKVSYQIKVLF